MTSTEVGGMSDETSANAPASTANESNRDIAAVLRRVASQLDVAVESQVASLRVARTDTGDIAMTLEVVFPRSSDATHAQP